MSASTSHKHHFKTGHLAETTIAHQFDCIGWTVLDSLLTQDAFLEIVGKRQQPSIQVITIISIRFKIHGYYILLSMLFSCFIDIVFFP